MNLQNSGNSTSSELLAVSCSIFLNKPSQKSMSDLGSMTLGRVVTPEQVLASTMKGTLEKGIIKVLPRIAIGRDMPSLPEFQLSGPFDAVYMALGVS